MVKKTYQNKNCDLDALSKTIKSWFAEQGYEVQSNENEGAWFIQARKSEAWRKVVGASRAFNVLIQGQPNEFFIEVGTGAWTANLAAGGVALFITGGFSLIGSGIAVGWSKKIEGDIWNFIEQKAIFGEKVITNDKLSQLKVALESGILSQEEFDRKAAAIQKEIAFSEKLKQLENAKNAGIITDEEFEQKKKILADSI
ncbi:MAG: SHOCT domain-containing protein [Fischerella sp. CENA71]|nr:SHOCT domain-containing protein [Fischerella sp. CENA71]